MMSGRTFLKLAGGVLYTTVVFGALLMVPAWTVHWWQAWVFLGAVFVASCATMFGIFPSRPDLLDERWKPPIQKDQPLSDRVILVTLLVTFAGLLVFIPVDAFRWRLLAPPGLPAGLAGLLAFAAGWTVIALALRANAFATPVVKHQADRQHTVADTGPYRVVRHPMYAGAVPVMVGMALWLGSTAGALLAAVPSAVLALRIVAEERFLRRALPGYEEYARRVRWRMLPFLW